MKAALTLLEGFAHSALRSLRTVFAYSEAEMPRNVAFKLMAGTSIFGISSKVMGVSDGSGASADSGAAVDPLVTSDDYISSK